MSKSESWTPEIVPLETLGEFRVESESDPGSYYMVDLFDYDGNGSCTCDDFKFRIGPMRDADIEPVHQSCKHIDRAFSVAGRELVKHLLKKSKEGQFKRR
jgi:hypothetical protein